MERLFPAVPDSEIVTLVALELDRDLVPSEGSCVAALTPPSGDSMLVLVWEEEADAGLEDLRLLMEFPWLLVLLVGVVFADAGLLDLA